jgi:hypothetical protein
MDGNGSGDSTARNRVSATCEESEGAPLSRSSGAPWPHSSTRSPGALGFAEGSPRHTDREELSLIKPCLQHHLCHRPEKKVLTKRVAIGPRTFQGGGHCPRFGCPDETRQPRRRLYSLRRRDSANRCAKARHVSFVRDRELGDTIMKTTLTDSSPVEAGRSSPRQQNDYALDSLTTRKYAEPLLAGSRAPRAGDSRRLAFRSPPPLVL